MSQATGEDCMPSPIVLVTRPCSTIAAFRRDEGGVGVPLTAAVKVEFAGRVGPDRTEDIMGGVLIIPFCPRQVHAQALHLPAESRVGSLAGSRPGRLGTRL